MLASKRRWCVTGTPLNNSFEDFNGENNSYQSHDTDSNSNSDSNYDSDSDSDSDYIGIVPMYECTLY